MDFTAVGCVVGLVGVGVLWSCCSGILTNLGIVKKPADPPAGEQAKRTPDAQPAARPERRPQPEPAAKTTGAPDPPVPLPVAPPPRLISIAPPLISTPTAKVKSVVKGVITLATSPPVAAGVRAWVEVDGVKSADWPVGSRSVELQVEPGARRVMVYAETNGVTRVIYDQRLRVEPGGRMTVGVGGKK